MEFTLTLGWWAIPAIVTIISIGWALFIYDDGSSGMLSGIGNIMMLIPALAISMISWIVFAFLK